MKVRTNYCSCYKDNSIERGAKILRTEQCVKQGTWWELFSTDHLSQEPPRRTTRGRDRDRHMNAVFFCLLSFYFLASDTDVYRLKFLQFLRPISSVSSPLAQSIIYYMFADSLLENRRGERKRERERERERERKKERKKIVHNRKWKFKKIKSMAYSSQESHTGQLDFCNWLPWKWKLL